MPQPKDLDWLNGYKSKTHTYAVFKRPTSLSRDTYKLKMRGWKKIFHANGNQKRWSNDTHIRQNRPENKEYDKRQRWALHNDQRTNPGSLQYIRQLLTTLKGEINNNTIIVGDFNTPLTAMDRSTRQKINKETQALNEALDQMDLIDIYRTFHPKAAEYTFFSSAHGTFSKIDHILGYKSNLSNFKKIEIISSIFSDHNAI